MTKVLKPFTTRVQRFAAGADVPADTDLSPHTLEGLTSQGFLEAPPKPSKSKADSARAAE
ncbi:hypothetical protein [Mesorhizobium neociceri]|uniref:Uncharacterized protein n=1 Tax=Mesorhizobium neociceri TaxID=1307853 RepID=A0A838B6I0_9HYPH|nr:hypothetical protein [Mesorhizobium neociceri]MBA1141753.1 hypothetical protein [Mesorhizobium neociceri]